MREKPLQVILAQEREDHEALRAMGRKGGLRTAEVRRARREQEEILAEIRAKAREADLNEVLAQRGDLTLHVGDYIFE